MLSDRVMDPWETDKERQARHSHIIDADHVRTLLLNRSANRPFNALEPLARPGCSVQMELLERAVMFGFFCDVFGTDRSSLTDDAVCELFNRTVLPSMRGQEGIVWRACLLGPVI
mgnify:CR=1 FL=1